MEHRDNNDNTHSHHRTGTNSGNNISSVDYFLLFDNNSYHDPVVPPPPPPTTVTTDDGAVTDVDGSTATMHRSMSVVNDTTPIVTDGVSVTTSNTAVRVDHHVSGDGEASQPHQHLPRQPMNGDNRSVSLRESDFITATNTTGPTSNSSMPGNRCRLGSSNTNTSTSTGVNTVSHSTNNCHHNHHKTGSAVGMEEQIYFDDGMDAVTVPSTTMERGESSYSLLVASSSSPTTPFLSTADPSIATSRHNQNRNRLYSNGSGSRSHHHHHHHRRTTTARRRHVDTPELSGLNILNAVTYTVHLIIWWTCGVWGMDHTMYTHWEQTQTHETLITPSTWAAHYLWVPIMTFEAIFSIAQLLPHYRARPIITSGTSYFFFYTVLLQITYTLLYGFGWFVFSFISIVLALFALLSLLTSQQYHGSADMPASNRGLIRTLSGGNIGNGRWLSSHQMIEYVLFSFPFYLHTGWLILMAVDLFSLLFRRYNSAIDAQLASDIVGLGVLLVAATYALNQPMAMGPDFVIPTVVLWSYVRELI